MTSSKGAAPSSGIEPSLLPPGGLGVGLEVGWREARMASSAEACWPGLGFGLGLGVKGEGLAIALRSGLGLGSGSNGLGSRLGLGSTG